MQVLANEPNKVFSLEDLENETGLWKQNLQQALYRAHRRGEVDRIAPGMYRYREQFRSSTADEFSKSNKSKNIHINSPDEYEIRIIKINLQVIDEIIGQMKLLRKQISQNNKRRRQW
jgi:hypothetical protein